MVAQGRDIGVLMFPIGPTFDLGPDGAALFRLAQECYRLAPKLAHVPAQDVPGLLRSIIPLIPAQATPLGGLVVHHLIEHLILQVRGRAADRQAQWDAQIVTRCAAYSGSTEGTKRLLWDTISLLGRGSHVRSRASEPLVPLEPRVNAALEAVRAHYHDGAFGLRSAATHAQLSPWYLDRLLARHTGYSFVHHLRTARLTAAQRILMSTLFSIKEVAAKVGYNSVTHLERDFRRHVGCSPSQWRRQNGNHAGDGKKGR